GRRGSDDASTNRSRHSCPLSRQSRHRGVREASRFLQEEGRMSGEGRTAAAGPLALLGVLALTAILYGFGLGARALWSEEIRWAQIPREMRQSGNYLWPTINGQTYYDKPLGSYWLVLAA